MLMLAGRARQRLLSLVHASVAPNHHRPSPAPHLGNIHAPVTSVEPDQSSVHPVGLNVAAKLLTAKVLLPVHFHRRVGRRADGKELWAFRELEVPRILFPTRPHHCLLSCRNGSPAPLVKARTFTHTDRVVCHPAWQLSTVHTACRSSTHSRSSKSDLHHRVLSSAICPSSH